MMVGEYSVTVTVRTVAGDVWTYELPRVLDFSVESEYDPEVYFRPPVPYREAPVRSIKFAMRPFTAADGKYMTVRMRERDAAAST